MKSFEIPQSSRIGLTKTGKKDSKRHVRDSNCFVDFCL